MRALLLAASVALLVSPALAHSSRTEGDRSARPVAHKARWQHERTPSAKRVLCPTVTRSRLQRTPHRRLRAASAPAFLLGSTAAAARARPRDRAGPVVPASYAVQLKAGLSGAERVAAMATLRDKYKLKIVKINRGLDLLRLRPRSARPADAKPAKSLGAALAPKIIQDLRKEPFVDAAYVDFPVSAPVGPASGPAGGPSRGQPQPGK